MYLKKISKKYTEENDLQLSLSFRDETESKVQNKSISKTIRGSLRVHIKYLNPLALGVILNYDNAVKP